MAASITTGAPVTSLTMGTGADMAATETAAVDTTAVASEIAVAVGTTSL